MQQMTMHNVANPPISVTVNRELGDKVAECTTCSYNRW